MRILTFTNCPLDPSLGSGKTVIHFAEGLRSLGHDVEVLPPVAYELWPGCRRGKKLRQSLGAMGKAIARLRRSSFDLVEFYGEEFWLATLLLSRWKGRPLIVAHTNGLELLAHERRAACPRRPRPAASSCRRLFRLTQRRLSRWAFSCADAFVSLCETDRQYVRRLGFYAEDRTAVIAPGLDREFLEIPFYGVRSDRVLFNGSWTPRKGISVLRDVAARLLSRQPQVCLDICGTRAEPREILGRFPSNLHDRIVIHPRLSTPALAHVMAQAKVFLFPSAYEGYGLALAEAMACGCAVVTTPTGLGADLRNGKEAFVCPFDDVDAMESAVLRLLGDEKLWRRMAHCGWERTRSLTWTESVAKLDRTYRGWIEGFRR